MGILLWATGKAIQLKVSLSIQLFKALQLLQDLVMDSWIKETNNS